jgi:UDP-N-acetylglucosamine--N-acetylmuramyl-(pentapeptide) pyrophosphoryl-undecaprenol N-acetylglucosamine transferase
MFGCDSTKPTVLIIGGGTGSQWLNQFVLDTQEELLSVANVIHVTGKGKMIGHVSKPGYFVVESMKEELADAYAISDVVVSRAGAGAISELAALKKAAIIIPLPNSPQEQNAKAIREASIVLDQGSSSHRDVLNQVRRLLSDPLKRLALGERLSLELETNCAETIVRMMQGK